MRFLLYGSKGWIGEFFLGLLADHHDIEVVIGKSRVDNEQELEREILTVKPTHVISTIGRTHGEGYTTIDYLEQKGKIFENVRDNLFSPLVLAILSEKYNFHFTYLATGCIYQYDETHPYEQEINGFDDDEKPNFFGSSYSTVKSYTDRLMGYFDSVLTLKIRMPIVDTPNGRNFITKIVNYEKICSIKNSMSVLDDLLEIMIDMIKHNQTGRFNFTNPGLISHNEILEMYREIVDPTFTWVNFTQDEQNTILAAGRSNNYLDTSKLEAYCQGRHINLLPIKESVRQVLIRMKENIDSV